MSKLSFGSTATGSMSDGSGDSNLNDLKMFSACLPMAYIRDDTWISPSSLCNRVAILKRQNRSRHSGHRDGASNDIASGGWKFGIFILYVYTTVV